MHQLAKLVKLDVTSFRYRIYVGIGPSQGVCTHLQWREIGVEILAGFRIKRAGGTKGARTGNKAREQGIR